MSAVYIDIKHAGANQWTIKSGGGPWQPFLRARALAEQLWVGIAAQLNPLSKETEYIMVWISDTCIKG